MHPRICPLLDNDGRQTREKLCFPAAKLGQTLSCPLGNGCICLSLSNHLPETSIYTVLFDSLFRIQCILIFLLYIVSAEFCCYTAVLPIAEPPKIFCECEFVRFLASVGTLCF